MVKGNFMKPANLVEQLKAACGEKIEAILLYGSAAAGDHVAASDYNVLVVTTDLTLDTLSAIAPIAVKWEKAGNPAPLLFTKTGLQDSTDVFPIELLDIHDCRKVLFGTDVIAGIEVNTENLRLEIEHELRGKLIQLRQRYIASGGKPKAVVGLMTHSLSTFLVLFRAALRLYEKYVPVQKMVALTHLEKQVAFESAPFKTVQLLKTGELKAKEIDHRELFAQYLAAIAQVIKAVDEFTHKGE
jgi:hypothetical protein